MMKETIEKHFKENAKGYFILLIVLFLGLTIGIASVNNLKTEQREELNTYLTGFTTQLKSNNKINYMQLLENSITNNIRFTVLLVLLSFSIWNEIGTIGLIGYKGFSLGYSISSAIAIFGIGKGLIFTLSLILLSEIIYIPSIFFISVQSIKTYRSIIIGDYDDKRILIIRYIISLTIAICLTLISSFLQTYLNSNLFLLFANYF